MSTLSIPVSTRLFGMPVRRPLLSVEALVLLVSLGFSLLCNVPFWRAAVPAPLAQPRFALSLLLVVTGLHALLLGLVATRWTLKPLLALLLPVTALAAYFMHAYGVYLDADMLRNVLHTDRKESSELMSVQLLWPLLPALLAMALVGWVQLRRRSWKRALLVRTGFLLTMLLLIGAGAALAPKDLASFVRNQREARYLVTPANYIVSLARVLSDSGDSGKRALLPVGTDARQAPRAAGARPRLLLLVVGETARAQNWGLGGYARQTTPELAKIPDLFDFPRVSACGSSTEVSLPCMFSPYGRRDYDHDAIRSHQSLLHVLDHAGVQVLWRDNQSGCKGVCDGLKTERLDSAKDPQLCNGVRCQDGILLKDLAAELDPARGDQVVVLHQLGNHGPNYFERYPQAFERYTPTCQHPDLGECTREQIVNAYDNALSYTDHVLASAIAFLRAREDYDSALVYVSDHGESLGEKGLFLHGVPYAIAPQEQLHVPMVAWFSPGMLADGGLDAACLRQRATQPASHDNLFSSVLGLMQVRTEVYDPELDLFRGCRRNDM